MQSEGGSQRAEGIYEMGLAALSLLSPGPGGNSSLCNESEEAPKLCHPTPPRAGCPLSSGCPRSPSMGCGTQGTGRPPSSKVGELQRPIPTEPGAASIGRGPWDERRGGLPTSPHCEPCCALACRSRSATTASCTRSGAGPTRKCASCCRPPAAPTPRPTPCCLPS